MRRYPVQNPRHKSMFEPAKNGRSRPEARNAEPGTRNGMQKGSALPHALRSAFRVPRFGGLVFAMTMLCAAALTGRAQSFVQTVSFTNLNRVVPDGKLTGLADTHSVTSSVAILTGLRVKLHIAGEFNGDLYGYIRHITANRTNLCVLLNRPGRSSTDAIGYA